MESKSRHPTLPPGFSVRLALELMYFDKWLAVLGKRSLNVRTDTDQRPSYFQVTLNSNQENEIHDKPSGRIIDLPVIQQNQASISQIADILEHLARFKLARDLEGRRWHKATGRVTRTAPRPANSLHAPRHRRQ